MFGLFGKSDEEIKKAIAAKDYAALPASVIEELAKALIVTTESHMPDYRIVQRIEVVSAECVFGMNLFKDLFAGVRDVFGGRSASSQKALREARRLCLAELRREALLLGANAVIGVDLDYSEISGDGKSMLFLVATGTAVEVEKLASS